MHWPEKMSPAINAMDVRTSFMQRLPGVLSNHQPYLPLYPRAFESFDLSEYDLVISNSSAFCKGARVRPGALHICYCLTPMRWVWQYDAYVRREGLGRMARLGLPPVIGRLKQWDLAANRGVDRFMAISHEVAGRIERWYGRRADVIYPPVDCAGLSPQAERVDEFYLVLGRMIPYKRMDLAVDACTRLGRRLIVAGSAGRDEPALRRRAGSTVEFRGRVSDEERSDLMARCRAFFFTGEEDFGITPLEANASGRPVIAYAAGGALETVVDGVTGVHFARQTVEDVVAAIERAELTPWDSSAIRAHAEQFDVKGFREKFKAMVEESMEMHAKGLAFG